MNRRGCAMERFRPRKPVSLALATGLLLWAGLPVPGAAQGDPSYGSIFETDGLPGVIGMTNLRWIYQLTNAANSAISKIAFTHFYSLTTNGLLNSPTSWKAESVILVGSNVWSFTLSAKSSGGYIPAGQTFDFTLNTTYDPTNTTLLYGPRTAAVKFESGPSYYMPDCSELVGPVGVLQARCELAWASLSSTGAVLRVAGVPGADYGVERALSVTGAWTAIGNVRLATNGLGLWPDTNPPASAAYYRAGRANTPVRVDAWP